MKSATYRGLAMTIRHASSHGLYIITATIRGREVSVKTPFAEVYDYFDCDYYDTKDKNWARRYAYNNLKAIIAIK